MATTQEQLAGVQAAIDAIEQGAQEYRIGQRLVRRGDLSVLYKERARLEQKLFGEENEGGLVYYGSTR